MPLTSWNFSILQYSKIRKKTSMKFVNLKMFRNLKVLRSYFMYCSLCFDKVSWFSDCRCSVPAETRNQHTVLFRPSCPFSRHIRFSCILKMECWGEHSIQVIRSKALLETVTQCEVSTENELLHLQYGLNLISKTYSICVFIKTEITDHTK
jgi:hypothetical protein